MFYQCLLRVYISVHVLPVSIGCLHLCPCSTSVYWVSTSLSILNYINILYVYVSASKVDIKIQSHNATQKQRCRHPIYTGRTWTEMVSIGCLHLCPCSTSVYWVSTALSMFYQCLLGVYISVHVLPVSIGCLHLCQM
jgi:hypothetical protein